MGTDAGVIVPVAAFVMVIILVAIRSFGRTREKELAAHQELRTREMEHERRLKELEVERAKIDLEKARISQREAQPESLTRQ